MADDIQIQDIEEMRQREGIDDVELREEVRRLRAGDVVKLTFLAGPRGYVTIPVRITSIRGPRFRGKLAGGAATASLPGLSAGTSIVFTRTHIHSVLKRQVKSE